MPNKLHLAICRLLLVTGVLGMVCPVFGGNLKVLHGHVPPAVAHLQSNGRLPAGQSLQLAIGLPLRNQAALDAFLQQLYDPASPNYHHYLTPEQFTEQFGPTEQDYQSVIDFARSNGLAITATTSSRLLLDVSGPVAKVEQAFHLTLRTYQHPTENRTFFAPDTEPSVMAGLSVLDVSGLSNYQLPHPKNVRIASESQMANAAPRAGSGPKGNYIGADFRAAYAPGVTLTGAGQMVGLLQFDGFYSNDITAYESLNGLPAIPLQTVLVDGYSGVPTTGANSGNIEVSLDIEMSMSMAPGLSRIVLFEGGPSGTPNDVLNAMASTNQVGQLIKQLSSSWGWSGGPSGTTDAIFQKMSSQGQTFFNASGDSDAFTTGAGSVNGVDNPSLNNAPSSSPYITEVGGTTLSTTEPGGSWTAETVWNWGLQSGGAYVGSSGGISSYYAIPSWQAGVSNLAGRGGSTVNRNTPDVALTADAVFVKYGNGLNATNVGGTSCASPLWAGFTALVNQQAAANGRPSVGFINPALYNIAQGANYAACFHDVTTGNNDWSSSPSSFSATAGYDLCTGLGTPAGQNLINALTDSLGITPLTGFTASGQMGGPFTGAPQTLTLTNTGASSLNWSLINTSSWLNFFPASGALAGGGQTNVTASLTAAANNLALGNHLAGVWFTNQTTHVSQLLQFTVQVLTPLAVLPATGFNSGGPVGGPFNITTQNFVLTNLGASSLSWSLINTSSWLNASPTSGTLAGGDQSTVTAGLTAAAGSLGVGSYTANLVFTNQNGWTVNLPFSLQVGPLVQNGGFETGDFTGWTLNGSSSYNVVTSTSSLVHSGSYGAALGQSGGLGYLSQTLNTSPGQNYVLSLWLDNPSNKYGATPNQFLVNWNGATIYNQANLPTMGWTNLQFFVTASGASTVLQFGFQDDPYYLGLDDISVTPLATPAFKTAQRSVTAFNMAWNAVTGLVYQVQYKTNLAQVNWINLGKPLIATNASLTVSDTNAVGSVPQRFYRLMASP